MNKSLIRKTLIGLILFIAAYLLYNDVVDLINYYMAVTSSQPLSVGITAGPININITDATDWDTVFKAVVTLLATYAGIRAINRLFE